jgi:hypothetical protein
MMKSVREKKGRRQSNIVWNPPQLTISRHLRGVVITEYGIAFLKGQSDSECIKRLIMIADAQFQDELLAVAQKNKKIDPHWKIPPVARNNTPEKLQEFTRFAKGKGLFKVFPFGSDFTPAEEKLQGALLNLKEKTKPELIKSLLTGFSVPKEGYAQELERMKLFKPQSLQEFLYQKVLLGSFKELARRYHLQ